MKYKTLLLSTLVVILASTRINVAQAEDIRVVVSYNSNMGSQSKVHSSKKFSKPKTCLETLDGRREICVPTPPSARTYSAVKSNTSKRTSSNTPYETITVDADSSEQVINTLMATKWYKTVEEDVVVSTPKLVPRKQSSLISASGMGSTEYIEPNDPGYESQKVYFDAPNDTGSSWNVNWNKTGIDFTKAKGIAKNGDRKVTVAVLDSSFWQNDEVSFVTGVQMSTAFGSVRGTEYIGEKEADRVMCSSHGFGVAGAIGAKSNNGKLVAGAIDNVDMVAVNVMDCGLGFLSDAADGLRWIAGESVEGVDDYTGDKIVVANLSLGGQSECPSYVQSAIDVAVNAGITVVVAAGNDSIDVSGFAPANCDNVVVVGALSSEGDRATFSNYGEGIDVAIRGESVLSTGSDDDQIFYWDGTSFAAPLATAAVAHAKREAPDLTPSAIEQLLKATATPITHDTNVYGGGCVELGCGDGQINAGTLVEWSQLLSGENEASQIKHALNEVTEQSECDQGWFFDNFGEKIALCDAYDLSFFNASLLEAPTFKLWGAQIGADLKTEGTIILTTSDSVVRLANAQIIPETTQYGYQICDGDNCGETIFRFSTNAIERPSACEHSD